MSASTPSTLATMSATSSGPLACSEGAPQGRHREQQRRGQEREAAAEQQHHERGGSSKRRAAAATRRADRRPTTPTGKAPTRTMSIELGAHRADGCRRRWPPTPWPSQPARVGRSWMEKICSLRSRNMFSSAWAVALPPKVSCWRTSQGTTSRRPPTTTGPRAVAMRVPRRRPPRCPGPERARHRTSNVSPIQTTSWRAR